MPVISLSPQRILLTLFFTLIFADTIAAQVIIRERVEITPKKSEQVPMASVTAEPTLFYSPDGINAHNMVSGGVEMRVTGTTFNAAAIPDGAGVDITLGFWGLVRRIVRDCHGNLTDTTFVLPPKVVNGCTSINVSYGRYYLEPSFGSCRKLNVGTGSLANVSVAGASATFTIDANLHGYRFGEIAPFTATVTVTASSPPGSELAGVRLTPNRTTLQCVDNTTTTVSLLNGLGQSFIFCPKLSLTVAASLIGAGPYAYLRQGAQEGSSISYPMASANTFFEVVLDTARGVIPFGNQQATLRVQVDNIVKDTTITLICPYPPPTVQITYPGQDTTIVLTATDQPEITLQETHTPTSGQFEPTISWNPSNILRTADYYEQIEDSLMIVVGVTATNIAGMTATDSVRITLKKEGCDGPPCPPSPVATIIEVVEVGLEYPNLQENPCQTQEALDEGVAGAFRALKEFEEPIIAVTPEVCFDPTSQRWKFSLSQMNVKVIVAVCTVELEARGYKLINSTNEVPDSLACLAYFHLLNQYKYPPASPPGGYFYLPALLEHERVHRQQYEFHLRQAREYMFDVPLSNLTIPCTEIGLLEEATEDAKQRIILLASRLMKEATGRLKNARNTIGRREFELLTHQNRGVINKLDQALLELDQRCN